MPPLAGARTAASPTTVGRTSSLADVKFYLLLPAGKSVSDVDTQAPMYLDLNGTRIPLARDPTYSHKKYTVATFTDRQKVLTAAGRTNGTKTATVSLRLKDGRDRLRFRPSRDRPRIRAQSGHGAGGEDRLLLRYQDLEVNGHPDRLWFALPLAYDRSLQDTGGP